MLEEKKVLAFSKICRFDPGSSIKLLASKIKKVFPLNVVQFYPDRSCHHLHQVLLPSTNICEGSKEKVIVNISHCFCTHKGDHLGSINRDWSI